MNIQRREFLGTALAGAAGTLVVGRLAEAAPSKGDPTAIVEVGKQLKTTYIGCGTGMRGGNRQTNQTRLGREKFEYLLQYAYDQNLRFFDLADLYGTHPYAARVLGKKPRDSYTLSSKIWWRSGGLPEKERPGAEVCVKRFLRELKTDYLDLCQLHCVTSPDWPQELRRYMDGMEKLKERGLIRGHGVSCHSIPALEAAAAEPWVDVVHARVNPFGFRTDGPMEKVVPVLKKMHAAGKGIIGMKLIGEGTFDPKQRRDTLRYVMGLGCVDLLIVGFEKPQEIDEFKTNVAKTMVRTRM